MMTKENNLLYFMLFMIWLIILALWAIIGVLIVPIEPPKDATVFILIIYGGGKVAISGLLVLLWLFIWYKSLDFILKHEFFESEVSENTELA